MKTIIILFLFSVTSYARMYCLQFDIRFDNEPNRNTVYGYILDKTSITCWKLQEEIIPYEISAGGTTTPKYCIYTEFRLPNKSLWQPILQKLKWVRDHMGDSIIEARINVHICYNDGIPYRRACNDRILYQKYADGTEYFNWDLIDNITD